MTWRVVSDVAENLSEVSCTDHTVQRNDFELLISTVQIEPRHPIDGYFGSEFPAFCNGAVMAA